MVRAPCFDTNGVKKGAWSEEEDNKLRAYIERYGHPNWRELPRFAGLSRCGKSCRLRWMNYLHPKVKRGNFTKQEEDVIISLHNKLGNKWSKMAALLPGRSDNEIKNHWHTHLKNRNNYQPVVKDEQSGVVAPHDVTLLEKGKNSFENNPNSTTQQEVEILLAVLSSSSSTSESSPCSFGVSDSAIRGELTPQMLHTAENIWIEPSIPDDSSFISSSDNIFSPLGLEDDLISQTLQDSLMDDMFLWST